MRTFTNGDKAIALADYGTVKIGGEYTFREYTLSGKNAYIQDHADKAYPSSLFISKEKLDTLLNSHGKCTSESPKEPRSGHYSFTVGDTKALRFQDILEDLSADSPLALITMDSRKDGVEYFALVHQSIFDKVHVYNMTSRFTKPIVKLKSESEFSEVVMEVGRLKRIAWPNKATVKVAIPKV
jgi:CRISPR/Cas system endoribonuclease Cas6 (RAMP superfamily)